MVVVPEADLSIQWIHGEGRPQRFPFPPTWGKVEMRGRGIKPDACVPIFCGAM
jgi:hypothetical protein